MINNLMDMSCWSHFTFGLFYVFKPRFEIPSGMVEFRLFRPGSGSERDGISQINRFRVLTKKEVTFFIDKEMRSTKEMKSSRLKSSRR